MSLGVSMRFKLKSDDIIGLLIMFLSLRELWPQVMQWQFVTLIWQVEMETLVAIEPLEVVELLGVVVQGHPLVHGLHYPHLTQLWNFSLSCNIITKRSRLKNYGVCRISNVSPMKACEKTMHGHVG